MSHQLLPVDPYVSKFEKRPKMSLPAALGRILVALRFAWPNQLVGFLLNSVIQLSTSIKDRIQNGMRKATRNLVIQKRSTINRIKHVAGVSPIVIEVVGMAS